GGNGIVDLAWYGATGGTGTSDVHNNWQAYMAQSTDTGATWTPYTITSQVIHQGALCVASDAACSAAQQSPPDPSVVPGLQIAVNQLTGAAVVASDDDNATPGLPSLEATRQCGGISAVSGVALVNDCAAPQQPPTPPAGSTCPGPQVTDLASDALDDTAGGTGQVLMDLDLTRAVVTQSPSGDLVAAITVQHLATGLGAPDVTSETWALYWTFKGANYYATATLAGGFQTYVVGTVNPDGTLGAGTPVTGALVPGTGGQVFVNIPAADVGSPGLRATLANTFAASYATFTNG